MGFIAEIFDGFEIEQAVDGFGACIIVGVVHGTTNINPAFGGPIGKPEIGHYSRRDHCNISPTKRIGQHTTHQSDFEHGRKSVEQRKSQNRIDAIYAARNNARKSTCAAFQVKL